MHDKFEKEVQQKMEELKLRPSEPVWEKIEMAITPERKRKRSILWLSLAVLLLGGGGVLTYQLSKDPEQEIGYKTVSEPVESSKINKNYPIEKRSAPKTSLDTSIKNKMTRLEPEPLSIEETTNRHEKEQVIETNDLRKDNKSNVHSPTEKNPIKEVQQKISELIVKKSAVITENNGSEIQRTEKPIVIKQESTLLIEDSLHGIKLLYLDSVVAPVNKAITPIILVDTSFKNKVAANKKWLKQANFAIGRSSYTNGALFNSSPTYAMANSPISSAGGGNNYYPSDIKGALGFTAGFAFVRKLNEHWELSLGLQYAYYSTTMNVGNNRRNDTTIQLGTSNFSTNQYYTNAGTKEFTNRFHVVEIPVTINYRPSVSLPLYLSLGAAYGRVVSTNALTFSSTANLYYKNDDNYLRNMLPVFFAPQVELFTKKKVTLRVGPSLQYNLLKLRKVNGKTTPHLFFAGLKAGINF